MLFPLSAEQRTIWLGQEFVGAASPAFVICGAFRLNGHICPDRLQQAISRFGQRQPIARARLRRANPEPRLQLGVEKDLPLERIDLSAVADPEAEAQRITWERTNRPFALFDEPLVRFTLLHLAAERHVLLIHAHHIALDAWATLLAFNEVAAIYNALEEGRDDPGLPEPVPYVEALQADAAYVAGSRYARDEAFWREYIAALDDMPLLPPLPGRAGGPGVANGHVDSLLGRAEFNRLCALGQTVAETATPTATLVALMALVAARLAGRERVTVWMPFLNRSDRRARRLLSHRVKVLPLDIAVDRSQNFGVLTAEVARTIRRAIRHAGYPVEDLVGRMGRRLPWGGLVEVAVNHVPLNASPRMGQAVVEPLQVCNDAEPRILSLTMIEYGPDRLGFAIDHALDHVSPATADALMRRLHVVIGRLIDSPDTPVGDVDLLLPEERALIVAASQGPARPRPALARLDRLYEAVVRDHGDAPAIIEPSGTVLSHGELDRAANRLARALLRRGVGHEQPVTVIAPRGALLVTAALAIWKAGATYLPIDTATPADRRDWMLADSGAAIAVLPEPAPLPPGVAALCPADWEGESDQPLPPQENDRDLAYLIYTSGSTGRPKGVMIEHRGFVNMILGQIELFQVTAADRVLLFASPAFDASLSEMMMALLPGAALVPVDRALIDTPWELRSTMTRLGVSVATLPPSYLRLFEGAPLPGLRLLITAGEAPIETDARRHAARLAYINAYGPTEISVCATAGRVWPHDEGPIGLGAPLPNVGVHVLDAWLRPLPPGAEGELCVSGPGVARGYLNRPDLTERQFVAAPWNPSERLYRTGDRVRLTEDGELIYLGRLDRQVKLRGQRVELGEIETLLTSHPDLAQAAVVPEETGGRCVGLTAFVVAAAGRVAPDTAALLAWLGTRLPSGWLPGRVVAVSELPLNRSGKIDRERLAATIVATAAAEGGRPPAEGVEAALAGLWAELLPPGPPITADDDFFARGGDSLTAIRLAQKIAEAGLAQLPARAVFLHPTLGGLAAYIAGTADATAASPALADTDLATHAQMALYAADRLAAHPALMAMPVLIEVDAAIPPERWRAALARVIARHDSLRTALVMRGEHLVREVIDAEAAEKALSFEIRDFSDARDGRSLAIADIATALSRPFALDRAPLLIAGWTAIGGGRALLYVNLHHAIADGHSVTVMLDEMARDIEGRPVEGLPVPFARAAAAERAYLDGPKAAADRAWWLERLAGAEPASLATDFPRPAHRRGHGAQERLVLTADRVARLQALGRRCRASQLLTLAALTHVLLYQLTGGQDQMTGLPVSTRDSDEFTSIGYRVATLPLLTRPRPETSFAKLLESAREDLLQALEHAAYPLDLLPPGTPGRQPAVLVVEQPAAFGPFAAIEPPLRVARADLTLLFTVRPDGTLDLAFDYDSDLFLPATVAGWLDRLAGLIDRFAADPEQPLGAPAVVPVLAAPAATVVSHHRDGDGAVDGDALAAARAAWTAVLGCAVVADDDSFFALGGDSITAIQVCGRLRQAGWDAAARSLIEHPQVARFAATLRRLFEVPPASVSVGGADSAPLLPIQAWLWREHRAAWDSFAMPLALRLARPLEPGRLRGALLALVRHHAGLRLRFPPGSDGLPIQTRGAIANLGWRLVERSDAGDPAADLVELGCALRGELSPAEGKLLAAGLLRHPAGDHLLLMAHHLVMDGVSWRILLDDLAAVLAHGPAALAPAGPTTIEWSLALASRPVAAEAPYWRSVLATPAPVLPPPARPGAGPSIHRRRLPGALARRLEQGRNELPAAALRLAAIAQALGRVLRPTTPALRVTIERHGRDAGAGLPLERAVGWFTAPHPFALPVAIDATAIALAEQIADGLRRVPDGGAGYLALADSEPSLRESDACLTINDHGRVGRHRLGSFAPLPDGIAEADGAVGTALTLTLLADDDGLTVEARTDARVDDAWTATLVEAIAAALTELAGEDEPSGSETNAPEILPLTPLQSGMLFQHLAQPDSDVHAQCLSIDLEGEADSEVLARAWAMVAARHASLRALFANRPDGPVQIIGAIPPHAVTRLDLTGLPEEVREREAAAWIATESARRFDLRHGPTMRVGLIRLGPARHRLVWSFHHILMDGWCSAILAGELLQVYDALAAGRSPALPPAPSPAPLLAWLADRDVQAARAYWRTALAGVDTATRLNARLPDGAAGAGAPFEHLVTLAEETSAALVALARRLGVGFGALMQAAWAAFLMRRTGRDDVVFGLVTSGREAPVDGIESLVYMLIRTLPLRARTAAGDSVAALARALHAEAGRRLEHETLPLPEIQAQTPLGNELFDHLLMIETFPADPGTGSLRVGTISGREILPVDLGISVLPGRTIGLRFNARPERYPPAFVAGLARGWLALLERVAHVPETPIAALPALDPEWLATLARRNAATARAWPDSRPLPDRILDQAARTPHRVAVVEPGGRIVDYHTLAARVTEIAERLDRVGAGPGDRVGVCLERDADLVATLLAIHAVGAAYVPLDPLYPRQRLAHILEDSGARLLVCTAATVGLVETPAGVAECRLDTLPWGTGRPWVSRARADDLAYIIYTSGSTGKPKGVAIRHRGLTNFLDAMIEQPGLGPEDTFLAVSTICFDVAGLELFGPLLTGGRVVVAPATAAVDGRALAALIEQYDVTVMQATPTGWTLLIESGWAGRPNLRALIGAEPLGPLLAARLRARVAELWNLYGPTETTVWSTTKRLEPNADGSVTVTIGTPIANTTAYVVGPDLQLLAEGEAGELCLGGAGLAVGYHARPELTAERFVPMPGDGGERVYRTGDRVMWDASGDLIYLGRLDHQIKLRGYRIEPGEIEARLTALTGIAQAVVGLSSGGNGEPELVAWLTGPAVPDDGTLRSWLAETLPAYMVPGCFVRLAAMPTNPNGKIDRAALAASEVAAPAAPAAPPPVPADVVDVAERLRRLFAEVLGVADCALDDNFFALGGHSLTALRLSAAIERALGVECPVGLVFSAPTPAELAAKLAPATEAARAEPPVAADDDAPMVLSEEDTALLRALVEG